MLHKRQKPAVRLKRIKAGFALYECPFTLLLFARFFRRLDAFVHVNISYSTFKEVDPYVPGELVFHKVSDSFKYPFHTFSPLFLLLFNSFLLLNPPCRIEHRSHDKPHRRQRPADKPSMHLTPAQGRVEFAVWNSDRPTNLGPIQNV